MTKIASINSSFVRSSRGRPLQNPFIGVSLMFSLVQLGVVTRIDQVAEHTVNRLPGKNVEYFSAWPTVTAMPRPDVFARFTPPHLR